MANKVRMKDIADAVGVSIVSVSKVLNGKQDGVGESVRAKILETSERMGYVFKKDLSGTKPKNVGVIVCEKFFLTNESFYGNMHRFLVKYSSCYNITILLEIIMQNNEKPYTTPNLIKNNQIDGLIFLGSFSSDYVNEIKKIGLPYVFLDHYNDDSATDFILSDSYNGSYALTKLLIENGHRNIRFVGDIHETSSIMDRYLGYLKALASFDLIKENDIVAIPDRDPNGTIYVSDDLGNIASAYVCNCDQTAFMLMGILNSKGLRVPEDVSIVGFDDSHFAYLANPPLTTYKVDSQMMSNEALRIIARKIEKKPCTNGRTLIPGEIISRSSIKKLN